jgi:glycosyltransferase involved in cell wall biosynthesis
VSEGQITGVLAIQAEMPLVTVVICTFNGEAYLEKTIDSVLAQSYKKFEVLLVDDGSRDETIGIIKRYAGNHACIRAFYRSNHGLPAARNFAFAEARGDWIAIIDQDDLCYPTRIARQVEVAKCYPSAGLVFCNTHYIDEADRVIGEHLSKFVLPRHLIASGLAANLLLQQGCFVDSEACFIKRETVRSIGALDETLHFACDYEYFIRVGFKVDFAYCSEVLAAWRIHSSQATKTNTKRFIEVAQVYRRYFWNGDVRLRTRASLLVSICKTLAWNLIYRLRRYAG